MLFSPLRCQLLWHLDAKLLQLHPQAATWWDNENLLDHPKCSTQLAEVEAAEDDSEGSWHFVQIAVQGQGSGWWPKLANSQDSNLRMWECWKNLSPVLQHIEPRPIWWMNAIPCKMVQVHTLIGILYIDQKLQSILVTYMYSWPHLITTHCLSMQYFHMYMYKYNAHSIRENSKLLCSVHAWLTWYRTSSNRNLLDYFIVKTSP